MWEVSEKLWKAEMHMRLLEKDVLIYKNDVVEIHQKMMKMEKEQLERTTITVGALEGELAEARRTNEKMEEVVKKLKEELERR